MIFRPFLADSIVVSILIIMIPVTLTRLSRCSATFIPYSTTSLRVIQRQQHYNYHSKPRMDDNSVTSLFLRSSIVQNSRRSQQRFLSMTDDKSDEVETIKTTTSSKEATKTTTIKVDSDISSDTSIYRNNKNNVRDQVISAISKQGGIKVTVCTVRNMVNDLMIQHNLTPLPTQALGRTVICGLLLSNGIQEEQNVQISIRTEDGPLRGIVAVVTGRGEVRGYVGTPALGNDWTLPEAVGIIGSVQIVKNHPSWPRPYNGITAVRYGDIDRDIGIYLAESEQRSCALAASCTIYDNILCHAAGGYLVEILPDCSAEEKEQVEQNLSKLVEYNNNYESNNAANDSNSNHQLPTGLLLQGKTPYDICTFILDQLDMVPLQEIEPRLKCQCNSNRLVRSLRLLPLADVEEILENEQKIEARCEFCGKVYRMTPQEVREKLSNAQGDPSKIDSDDE